MMVSRENPIHPALVDTGYDDNEKVNPSGSVWSGHIRIFSAVSPTAPTSPD